MERMLKRRLIKWSRKSKLVDCIFGVIDMLLLIMCLIFRKYAFIPLWSGAILLLLFWDVLGEVGQYKEEVIMENKLVNIIMGGKWFTRHMFGFTSIYIIWFLCKDAPKKIFSISGLIRVVAIAVVILFLQTIGQRVQKHFNRKIIK